MYMNQDRGSDSFWLFQVWFLMTESNINFFLMKIWKFKTSDLHLFSSHIICLLQTKEKTTPKNKNKNNKNKKKKKFVCLLVFMITLYEIWKSYITTCFIIRSGKVDHSEIICNNQGSGPTFEVQLCILN